MENCISLLFKPPRSYIIQTVIAYQNSAPTKSLLKHAGSYNYENDHMILLNIEKGSEIHNIFIENSRYFHFYLHFHFPPCMHFLCDFARTTKDTVFSLSQRIKKTKIISGHTIVGIDNTWSKTSTARTFNFFKQKTKFSFYSTISIFTKVI